MFLVVLGDIGAILILPVSMGGDDFNLYFAIIFLVIGTTGAMYLAWYNIKRQQIDQHRKWMLRAMFWMGIIVTMRIIQVFMMLVTAYHGGYVTVSHQDVFVESFETLIDLFNHKFWTCDQVRYVTGNGTALYEEFPACSVDKTAFVGVPADLRTRLHIGSLVRLTFSTATWVAIVLHTFGVELYVCLSFDCIDIVAIFNNFRYI